jgi:hypothetical protein
MKINSDEVYLPFRQIPSPYVLTCKGGNKHSPVFSKCIKLHHKGLTLMILPSLNYHPPKAPPPVIIASQVKILPCEFWKDTVQSITITKRFHNQNTPSHLTKFTKFLTVIYFYKSVMALREGGLFTIGLVELRP